MAESDFLSHSEKQFLAYTLRFGPTGYPVSKVKSRWVWIEAFGIKGSQTTYHTKRAAVAAVDAYVGILLDRQAGLL